MITALELQYSIELNQEYLGLKGLVQSSHLIYIFLDFPGKLNNKNKLLTTKSGVFNLENVATHPFCFIFIL